MPVHTTRTAMTAVTTQVTDIQVGGNDPSPPTTTVPTVHNLELTPSTHTREVTNTAEGDPVCRYTVEITVPRPTVPRYDAVAGDASDATFVATPLATTVEIVHAFYGPQGVPFTTCADDVPKTPDAVTHM